MSHKIAITRPTLRALLDLVERRGITGQVDRSLYARLVDLDPTEARADGQSTAHVQLAAIQSLLDECMDDPIIQLAEFRDEIAPYEAAVRSVCEREADGLLFDRGQQWLVDGQPERVVTGVTGAFVYYTGRAFEGERKTPWMSHREWIQVFGARLAPRIDPWPVRDPQERS